MTADTKSLLRTLRSHSIYSPIRYAEAADLIENLDSELEKCRIELSKRRREARNWRERCLRAEGMN